MGHVHDEWWRIKDFSSKLSAVWNCFCRWRPGHSWSHGSCEPESQSYQVCLCFYTAQQFSLLSVLPSMHELFRRETTYGKMWCFTSDLSRGDTAYTNMALDRHTDTSYFHEPCGYVWNIHILQLPFVDIMLNSIVKTKHFCDQIWLGWLLNDALFQKMYVTEYKFSTASSMRVQGEGRSWWMAFMPQRNYGSVPLKTLSCSHVCRSDTSTLKCPKLTKTTFQVSALCSASIPGTVKFTRSGKLPPLQLFRLFLRKHGILCCVKTIICFVV